MPLCLPRIGLLALVCAFVAFACDEHAPRDEDDGGNQGGAGAKSGVGGDASSGGSAEIGGQGTGGHTPAVCGDGVCDSDEDCEPVNWIPKENPCEVDCGRCPGWCVPTEQGGLTECNPFTHETYNGDPCPGICQWISDYSFQFYCTADGSATQTVGESCDQGVGGPYCGPGLACPDEESNVDNGEVCEQICCSNDDCPVGNCVPSSVLFYVGVCQ